MLTILKTVSLVSFFVNVSVLQSAVFDKKNELDFRTRVLQDEKINQTKQPVVLLSKNRSRQKLQSLFDRRTKPVCSKEILTSTLATERFQNVEGNGTNQYLSVIDSCCKGFKYHPYDRSRCIPDCEGRCQNGQCVAPNVCNCYPHFVPSLSQDCVSTCPQGCLNGVCHSNGTCICDEGYRLEPFGKFCVPDCKSECGSERNCTAPGVCSCYTGYVENSAKACVPICTMDCLHGDCVAPETCSCNYGYYLKNGVCQALCANNCINGLCIAPNHCMCNEGYFRDPLSKLCVPKCSQCDNGVCVAPETCRCFDGYQNTLDWRTCEPYCEGGCYGGICYDPGKCDCSMYTLDLFKQCKSTGKCMLSFASSCIWWINHKPEENESD